MIVRRTASAPRRWPATRGSPRAFAQRPFPSMMIATWTGGAIVAPCAARVFGASDMHDVFFFGCERLVDLLHILVCQLLDLAAALAVLVLGDLMILFEVLERLHA